MIARDSVYAAVTVVWCLAPQFVLFHVCSKPTSRWNGAHSFIYNWIFLGQDISDGWGFFSYSVRMCALFLRLDFEHGWPNFTVHSRETPAVSFGPQSNNSRTMSMYGSQSQNDRSKEESIKSRITQRTHHAHSLSTSHQCTLLEGNSTQQWSLFKHPPRPPAPPPPPRESTASVIEGWNDQS